MRRTLYRQDRLNGSSRGSEDGSSTCGESITASDVSKESGFDNKSEISEGERSSPGILMKQKIRVQNEFLCVGEIDAPGTWRKTNEKATPGASV